MVKNPPAMAGSIRDSCLLPELEDPLEEGVTTHSSVLTGESQGQRSLEGDSACGR